MKLLSAQQIRQWDQYTIEKEPVASVDLMERAAEACVKRIEAYSPRNIICFCGKGNNGGDGLAIARLLAARGHSCQVFVLDTGGNASPDFTVNEQRLNMQGKVPLRLMRTEADFPACSADDLLVDALYGTGLSKPVEGLSAALVHHINRCPGIIVSIDMPSGLPVGVFSAKSLLEGPIVEARETFTFQVPKQSFLHAEAAKYTGSFHVLDIGLHPGFPDLADSNLFYLTADMIRPMLRPRHKFAHKGVFGHALTIGGSFGKIGAALLMRKAALRTGCGLVTSFVPKVGYTILQTALPECMLLADDELYEIRHFPDTHDFDAVGIGPGMGTHEYTLKSFSAWLPLLKKPCVIDADALNNCARLLLEHHETFRFPAQTILTPHPKEFDRMAGLSADSFERLEKQIRFAVKYQVVVVLKGGHTSVALPDGTVYFNSTGNPAMATAGSGDALTGMITALLAQGYSTAEAAMLGVFIHGRAGDIAAKNKATIIASDLIEAIPEALLFPVR